MSAVLSWLPWFAVALIPGGINVLVALKQLVDDCRFLPFFEPLKNWGVWVWAGAQLLFPSVLFWVTVSLSEKPVIDYMLLGKAVGFGLGFITVINSRTDTGFFTVDLKIIYARSIAVAYALIAAKETRRTASFWTDVERQLNLSPDLTGGLDFLENYFRNDVSLTPEEKEDRQRKLIEIRKKTVRAEQAETILALMDVRRADLPDVLQRFGVSFDLLKKYFPQSQTYATK